MHDWTGWLLAAVILAAAVAITVWVARNGRKIRGLAGLGAIMLGFGEAIDPPQKHRADAADQKKGSPENDEPKDQPPNDPLP